MFDLQILSDQRAKGSGEQLRVGFINYPKGYGIALFARPLPGRGRRFGRAAGWAPASRRLFRAVCSAASTAELCPQGRGWVAQSLSPLSRFEASRCRRSRFATATASAISLLVND